MAGGDAGDGDRKEERPRRSRVVLRDDATPEGPMVRPAAERGQADRVSSRYDVVGEIARGGMGVILKARDRSLGRDVAVKLLREEFAGREDVVARFVEEAQIGGQLQHPGIVPVYELGLQAAGRPFFTMKLVKGRTLAALLTERPDPATDRRRFVTLFESVCETVAYAHARGVLHRDLKPSNVMVGAFGEVQVTDWGLAKVLGHERPSERHGSKAPTTHISVVATVRSGSTGSGSLVGSVLGTPAYMSPEQARGETEGLDERADVFSLGAILCEILTGQPPYAGPDHEIVERAARADLADANARLAASGADPELVRICAACLAPARDARPRNAKALADEVAAHLAALETRAREARVAAAEAEVRAKTAARAKRLTRGIVAVVVASVAVAAAVTVSVVSAREDRRAVAERAAAQELGDAERAAEQARASGDPAVWKEASAAAARALELVKDAAPEAEARVAAAAARISADAEGAAQSLAERQARASAQRGLLEAIVTLGGGADTAADADRLAGALRAAGVDPDGDVAAGVTAVQASESREDLLRGLDALGALRLRIGGDEGSAWRIASLADEDPVRARIRGTRDAASLRALAARLGDPPDPRAACLLGDRIGSAGDATGAVAVLLEARTQRLDDFWLQWTCGFWERRADPPDFLASARSDAAALALRPEMTVLWPRLAESLGRGGDAASGLAAGGRAEELAPDSPLPQIARGCSLLTLGDVEAAEKAFRVALERDGRSSAARTGLVRTLLRKGDRDAALTAAEAAVKNAPETPEPHVVLATVRLARQEVDLARSAAVTASRLGPRRPDAWVVRARCAWLEGDVTELRRSVAEARRLDPQDGPARSAEALVHLLDRDLFEAHASARSGLDRAPDDAWCSLALALVLERRDDALGADWRFVRAIEANPWFTEARRAYAQFLRRTGRLEEGAEQRIRAVDSAPGAPARTGERARAHAAIAAAAARLVGRLPATVEAPRSSAERAVLAEALAARGRAVAAARLRSADAPPDSDGPAPARTDAARSCVLAGLGWCYDGFDADGDEAAALLARGRELLAAQVDAWERAPSESRGEMRDELRLWLFDADLARVDAAAARGEISPEEAAAWTALWDRVRAALATAQGGGDDGR